MVDAPLAPCPICKSPDVPTLTASATEALPHGGQAWTCRVCGSFVLGQALVRTNWAAGLSNRDRGLLSGAILRATASESRGALMPTEQAAAELRAHGGAPRTTDETVTLLLSLVAREAPSYGSATAHYTQARWASRLYLYPPDAGVRLIREVVAQGWVTEHSRDPKDNNAISLELKW
jgi:hypothetical protein